jgi:hypothetical protein
MKYNPNIAFLLIKAWKPLGDFHLSDFIFLILLLPVHHQLVLNAIHEREP